MTIFGTHYKRLKGSRNWGKTLPSAPKNGEEFIDNINNKHCIYDVSNGGWWCADMTTSTSTSTTSTSSSTTTSTTTSTSVSTSTTSTSSSTTTSI